MTGPTRWRTEIRAMLALALPLIGAGFAQMAILTTDVLLIGRLGADALAAGSLGASLVFAAGFFGLGVMSAVAALVAQAGGGRDVRVARRTLRQGLWVGTAIWLPAFAVLWWTEAILLALGQDPAVSAATQPYVRACLPGLLPMLWLMALRSFLSALSRPRAILVTTLIGVAVNAALAWTLIFGHFGAPALGLLGAGIAASSVNLAMFLALAVFVQTDRRLRRYHLFGRLWRADWPRFAEILRVGLPAGGTMLMEVGVFTAAVFLQGLIGTASLAAHQIAIQCASITFMVPMGLAQAATVRVALAAGRGDARGVRLAGWTALALGLAVMALAAIAFVLAPRILVGAFIDPKLAGNAAVFDIAVSFLAVAAAFQLVDGAQVIGAGALRGLKDTRVPMVYALAGYWGVGFVAAVLLGFVLDLDGFGIWIGLGLGLAAVAVLMVWRFACRDRLHLMPAAPAMGAT